MRTRARVAGLTSNAAPMAASVQLGPASPWLALSRMRAWVRALAGATPRPIMVCSQARSSSVRTTTCRLRTSASCSVGPPEPHEDEGQPPTTQLKADELLAQILAGFGGQQAQSVLAEDPSYGPGWVVLYSLGELCWELSWALLALLLLLFPTGRLPSRRWRPVAWAAGAVLPLAALSSPLLPGPPAEGLRPNPIAIPSLEGVLRLAYATASSVLFGVILAALVSLVVRFR